VTTSTLFQAGSISKPVAAMCALRLVAQGALDLDVDVNEVPGLLEGARQR
jgi:CubicO group peptidase (beta-lactamase class C family)